VLTMKKIYFILKICIVWGVDSTPRQMVFVLHVNHVLLTENLNLVVIWVFQ